MKKDVPLWINFLTKKTPYKGLCADSGEKHEPASDIDAAIVDSLKALDPSRPIREADSYRTSRQVGSRPQTDSRTAAKQRHQSISSSAIARTSSKWLGNKGGFRSSYCRRGANDERALVRYWMWTTSLIFG